MTKISATIVADSKNPQGDRITSMLITFPRFILAELNTHRMLSKNSASSRAIPFNKMVESVKNNPFIPIAWQKHHSGMQGTEYFNEEESRKKEAAWYVSMQDAVACATNLYNEGVTKQLCNRLLEPFMWHTVLITGTEWKNFFDLRCPQYYFEPSNTYYKSKKDWIKEFNTIENGVSISIENNYVDWLKLNKGQAEIHMMMLSEKMYDAFQESNPKILKPNEWHIPMIEIIED